MIGLKRSLRYLAVNVKLAVTFVRLGLGVDGKLGW